MPSMPLKSHSVRVRRAPWYEFPAIVMVLTIVGVAWLQPFDVWPFTPAGAQESTTTNTDTVVPVQPEGGGGTDSEIITGETIFFSCAIGGAVGAIATAFPPLMGWAMVAGALPAVAALLVTSGIGCSVGLFSGVFYSTVVWMSNGIGAAFDAVF